MEPRSGVANWTEIAVATAVDPHWGPLAVNATNQSLREVDRTRHFADAVDFKVKTSEVRVVSRFIPVKSITDGNFDFDYPSGLQGST